MNDIFVDTSGWANFFIPSEIYHQRTVDCVRKAKQKRQQLVTTNYVIAELVALLGSRYPLPRNQLFQHINAIKALSPVRVIYIKEATDTEAWNLCQSRPDKLWSLVDASSFVVMKQQKLSKALTTDRHFVQAGFIRLLE